MKEVLQIAAIIIASLGGGGAIVLALSSWLGKVWANRILEREKAEHAKEIESYKSDLKKELDAINAIKEKALYISKAQYDDEYKICQVLWDKMFDCCLSAAFLFPRFIVRVPIEKVEKAQYHKDKFNEFVNTYNDYLKSLDRFAPFFNEEFYYLFCKIKKMCSELGAYFETFVLDIENTADLKMDVETHRKVYIEIPEKIDETKNLLRKKIRNYLIGLQLK